MEIAVSCDIVVAAEHARFGLTEPKVGLIASTGGLVRMARDVPRKAAMDMLLTARLVHADEAKEIGLPAETGVQQARDQRKERTKRENAAQPEKTYIRPVYYPPRQKATGIWSPGKELRSGK